MHQIDVLTQHTAGLHQYRTAISCKQWNKKVGLSIVRDFSEIVDDARFSKGVIVSKMGFTAPAIDYAESKNIGLVELRKPVDSDWNGYIREIRIMIEVDRTEIYDVHFQLTSSVPCPSEEFYQGGPNSWRIKLNQIFVSVPGEEATAFQNLADSEWIKDEEKEDYHIRFPEGSVLTVPDDPEHPAHDYLITGASFKVRFNPPISKEIIVRADDHVYMIMESLFDGRRFTITKDGKITERPRSEDDHILV